MLLYRIKRHPFAVTAHFRHCLVLTYAFPSEVLQPLLPPGLRVDTYEQYAFLALALVETERMRPSVLPAFFGRDFFLSGYRIFTRLGSSLRGLRILRSYTDKPLMGRVGNLLTHYQYQVCRMERSESSGLLGYDIATPDGTGDLQVSAVIDGTASLPAGSPFPSETEARRFAGPLPYTFDYEQETNSIVRIVGVRSRWNPRMVEVEVRKNSFLHQERFRGANPILANAFYLNDVPYKWEPGVVEPL